MMKMSNQCDINRMKCGCILLWLSTLLMSGNCATYYLSSTLPANTQVDYINYSIPVFAQTVAVRLQIVSDPYSNLVMVASSTPFNMTLSTTILSQMYHAQSSIWVNNMDVFQLIHGNSQTVNVHYSSGTGNTVYMALFNLDLPVVKTDKTWRITLATRTTDVWLCFNFCPSGASLSAYCYCKPCSQNYQGKSCSIYVQNMKEGEEYKSNLAYGNSDYYIIRNPPQTLELNYQEDYLTHNINLYVQFQGSLGGIAGDLNNYYDNSTNTSYSKLVSTTKQNFTFQTGRRNVLVTLTSKTQQAAVVTLSYGKTGLGSQLALILGLSLGILVLIILIIVLVCIYRKKKVRQVVQTQNSFYLTKKQINLYYPQVEGHLVEPYLAILQKTYKQPQDDEIKDMDKEEGYQCVICLNTIDKKSKVRVTYCEHVFHSHCLLGWFKKNQNCPFCRHECNRQPSEEDYDRLRGMKDKFGPKDLVTAILKLAGTTQRKLKLQMKAEKEMKKQQLQSNDSHSIEQQIQYSNGTKYQSSHKSSFRKKGNRGKMGKLEQTSYINESVQHIEESESRDL